MVMYMVEHKIGIVGGSGFVGSAIARYLVKAFKVKIIDIEPSPFKSLQASEFEFEKCDIREYYEVEKSLMDVDLVIHTAIIQLPLINEEKRLGYEVNVIGTQNLCKVVAGNPQIKGLILTSSWHVFGESGLSGTITEEFGFRPDKVQERARLYALCKIAQETVVRIHDELSEKIFGVVRIGTVLGEEMPRKTAANLFISQGLNGEAITPYKDSMHRPMLYIDVGDVQKGFASYAKKMLNGRVGKEGNSLHHVVNLCWPNPVTIIELAQMTRDLIIEETDGNVKPQIKIVDTGHPNIFAAVDRKLMRVDINKAREFLGMKNLTSPQESLRRIIRERFAQTR